MLIKSKYLYLALVIYGITAYFSLGHLHPDEYYQILEFAAYKLSLNSPHGLTWEFYTQIRPAMQAWVVVYLYKFIAFITRPNPFFVAFLTRAIAGILSLIAVTLFIKAFINELKSTNKQIWFILLSLFSWLAVFNAIRYSSENISAKLFIIGLSLLFLPNFRRTLSVYLFIGFMLGLSFVARYQVGFMICGLMAWLLVVGRLKLSYWIVICLGIFLAVLAGVTIDHWFYGDWVFTPWRYFNYNIILGKVDTFSRDPWYMYLAIAGLIPYGILYIFATLYFILYRRTHVFTWIMLPFIVVHMLIIHKELRFLTPLLTFMPFVVLDSVQILASKYNWHLGPKFIKINTISWRLNCVLLVIVMFTPPAMQLRINELLYNRYQGPTTFNYLTEGGNVLDFYKHVNLTPVPLKSPINPSCGVGENCLIALTCQETVKYGAPKGKLIFSDCPPWIFKLDFNNWLERTALYNIYELKSVNN